MKKQSYKLELNGLVIEFDVITYPSCCISIDLSNQPTCDFSSEKMVIKKMSGKNAAEVTEQLIYQNKKEWQLL